MAEEKEGRGAPVNILPLGFFYSTPCMRSITEHSTFFSQRRGGGSEWKSSSPACCPILGGSCTFASGMCYFWSQLQLGFCGQGWNSAYKVWSTTELVRLQPAMKQIFGIRFGCTALGQIFLGKLLGRMIYMVSSTKAENQPGRGAKIENQDARVWWFNPFKSPHQVAFSLE